MTTQEFYEEISKVQSVQEVESALTDFEESLGDSGLWVPVGGEDHENNSGIIEVSGDPGRARVEMTHGHCGMDTQMRSTMKADGFGRAE